MARVKGARELKLKLEQIPKEVRQAVWQSFDKSADQLMQLQRRLAPVEHGGLIASIRKHPWPEDATHERGLKMNIIAGGLPTTAEFTKSGKRFDRAVLMEFGVKPHRNKGIFAGSQNPGVKPRPFFFPAFRAYRSRIKSATSRAISTACKKVAAR